MAAEKQKQPPEEPLAVTYYATRKPPFQVWRVAVYGDKVKRELVAEHPNRLVVRDRLRVLLDTPEVMP